jgi:glucokinase
MKEEWLIGVDIGGTTCKIALISDQGQIVDKGEVQTNREDQGEIILDDIAKYIQGKLDQHPVIKGKIKGIGVGAPGPVDPEKGIIYHPTNLAWPDDYPLRDLLERKTKLPVKIDNDANCAALGEMWKGAGEGAKNLICVTLGTGVGGGVIVNGRIVQGMNGAGGEIGHITSVPSGGVQCNCGKRGCLETIASATGIVRVAIEFIQDRKDHTGSLTSMLKANGKITAKNIFDLASNSDETALKVVKYVTNHLGFALANIANTLNPEKIVIGGGVSKAGNSLLDPLQSFFQLYVSPYTASTKISLAKLGNDAGVIGAAWLIKNSD